MRKKSLQVDGMDTVTSAQKWASELTRIESRGNGDKENAWQRLANRYGIEPYTFWSLRYRPPKDIAASVWVRLGAAYQAECQRQMRKLEHEIEITKAIVGPDDGVVAQAEAFVSARYEFHKESPPEDRAEASSKGD